MPLVEDSQDFLHSPICLRPARLLPGHGDDEATDKKSTKAVYKGVPTVDDGVTAGMMIGTMVALLGMRRPNHQRSRYKRVQKDLRVLGTVEVHSVGRWPVLILEEAREVVAAL